MLSSSEPSIIVVPESIPQQLHTKFALQVSHHRERRLLSIDMNIQEKERQLKTSKMAAEADRLRLMFEREMKRICRAYDLVRNGADRRDVATSGLVFMVCH